MHSDYKNTDIRQLRDEQTRYAPRDKKFDQLERTEKLLREIDPKREYPFSFLRFRVTGFAGDETEPAADPIRGDLAHHDLRLFLEDLSDSADISVDEIAEPVLTLDEVSRMFNVSTKTISRWRDKGLTSRRFIFGGRKRVGFLQSSVEYFQQHNQERVKRGERFSQMTGEDRDDIIALARRMVLDGGCPADITRRIAGQKGRSVETIRYTIRQFDEEHPTMAVFPGQTGPLTEEAKNSIYSQHRQMRSGDSIEKLAKKYCRTVSSIHRIVNEVRAKRILELPLDYIYNECFEIAANEAEILAPMPGNNAKAKKSRVPAGLPHYLASLYETPLLVREQEYHLFRRFNYLKHKASKLREKLDPAKAKAALMQQIEDLYAMALVTKNKIIKSNLRLVVSIAKRHVSPTEDFFPLVSDGNMSLIRAVEKFDYARGNKFSTYASWAIMKNFARTIPEEFKHRDRFRTSTDEMFSSQEDDGSNLYLQELAQHLRKEQVDRILSKLNDREKKIIVRRFGLDHKQEPQTLKEVGAELGVTKERIRQIEARALGKLRLAAQDEKIDPPGDA